MTVRRDLIFDVGMFDGGDTDFYLKAGYRVVAIDANPAMIDAARARFATAVADGRLTLVNAGISRLPGSAIFHVSDNAEWSSFNRGIATRNGTPSREVEVPTMPFGDVMARYGVPHYAKIDIEGLDDVCVEAIGDTARPTYVSVETEASANAEPPPETEALALLEALRQAGYRRFKLVDQTTLTPVRPGGAEAFAMRALNSLSQGRLRLPVVGPIAARFTDAERVARINGHRFEQGSSGPFGDGIPGAWMSFDVARDLYLRRRRAFFARGRVAYAFWHDWHATV